MTSLQLDISQQNWLFHGISTMFSFSYKTHKTIHFICLTMAFLNQYYPCTYWTSVSNLPTNPLWEFSSIWTLLQKHMVCFQFHFQMCFIFFMFIDLLSYSYVIQSVCFFVMPTVQLIIMLVYSALRDFTD